MGLVVVVADDSTWHNRLPSCHASFDWPLAFIVAFIAVAKACNAVD